MLRDSYRIEEITPPPGYVLRSEPVFVSPDDFGSDKAVLKTIQNELEKTSVPVSKVWNDADDQDGIRPLTITVKLLADDVDTGKTLELNADNKWTGTFTDLDEYKDGKKIVYTISEDSVRGYRYAALVRAMRPAKSFILDNWRGMWYNRYTFGGIAY